MSWTRTFLRLGLILLAVGLVPALLVAFIFRGIDPLIPGLLALSAAPLGALALAAALIFWIVGLFRRD